MITFYKTGTRIKKQMTRGEVSKFIKLKSPNGLLDDSGWVDDVYNFFKNKDIIEERDFLRRTADILADHISATNPAIANAAGKIYLDYLRHEAHHTRIKNGYKDDIRGAIAYGMDQGVYEKSFYGKKSGWFNLNVVAMTNNRFEGCPFERFCMYKFKNKYLTYAGAKTIEAKYLGRDKDGNIFETWEERIFLLSCYLSKNEKKSALKQTIHLYKSIIHGEWIPATPTLMNAGRSYGQLSSCFIDTMEDDLSGIFHTLHNAAINSKGGGGISVYLGKIRSEGADIKHIQGASKGVLSWMKLLNDTAVSVDQMGSRQGAISVYLDVWHRDIVKFLESANVNGDDRFKSLDLFAGVCIPDLFMRKVDERSVWHLFDPHEVGKVMGFRLEDSFDKRKAVSGEGEMVLYQDFTHKYNQCVKAYESGRLKLVTEMPAIELMKLVMIEQLETGRPYMFYRDTANRANTMKEGIIYSSNLCTEIFQNMSSTKKNFVHTDQDSGSIHKGFTRGDYVVCNLSSLVLPNLQTRKGYWYSLTGSFRMMIECQVRALDNVIDLNSIEVPEAELTNKAYRPIGIGSMGKHTYLTNKGIRWESKRAIKELERVQEKISYEIIRASMLLAKEKGAFPLFEKSKWSDGSWFDERGLTSKKWTKLKEDVIKYGIRNAYLMAIAPTATISEVMGVSPSHDPAFKKFFIREKKGIRVPNIAGGLTKENFFYFKDAWLIDQKKSIKQTARIQRFVDQGISHNIYVPSNIPAKDLLDLHMYAWNQGLKSTYYVRAENVDIEECESCHV